MASSSEPASPTISAELTDVLFRASLINAHREKEFDLSFTAILLGFLASRMPFSIWFQEYIATHKIDVDDMLSSRNVDRKTLAKIAEQKAENPIDQSWRETQSARSLLDEASDFLQRVDGKPSTGVDERHLLAAYIYRPGPGHEKQLAEWGFDRVNWSNAFLAQVKAGHNPEFNKWAEIHKETFNAEPKLSTETAQDQSRSPNDQTQLLLDSPARQDILGRKYFAETLAVRLNRAWKRYRDSDGKGSFMLHIHGTWGSGKSSLLNLLKDELQPNASEPPTRSKKPKGDDDSLDWIVVDFNAWQRQRIEPPWWSLIDTIYTQARNQLKTVYGEPVHAWKLRARERWWRFTTGRRDNLIAMLISLLFLGGVIVWRHYDQGNLITGDLLKSAATVLGLIGGVWSTLLLVSRSLISGSSQSAQAFMQQSGDPMERVSKHFINLIDWIEKPVVIFVDDLDRCQTNYVVTLLEGIQTLFNNPRVVYVIAADRRWLHVCFEKIYETFVDAVKEPGRQLGSLFLEKAFELSISVPRISPERRRLYWDHLVLGTQPSVTEIESMTAEIQSEFKNDRTEAAVLARLSVGTGDTLRDEIRKGAALRQLANQDVAESTEYFLKPFVDLTEPNPRAMKRLVNAYTFLRDLAVLGGSDLLFDLNTRRQLALWSIVSLRWPLLKDQLEEYLDQHPDESPDVIELICDQSPIPTINSDLQQLVKSREVIKVFNGNGIGTRLDKETICALVGISAAQPKSGGVA